MSAVTVHTIEVSDSWVRFITFVKMVAPHSDMCVQFVNGEPTKHLSTERNLDFSKPDTFPNIPIPEDLKQRPKRQKKTAGTVGT